MGRTKDLIETWWHAFEAGRIAECGAVTADDVDFRGPGAQVRGRTEVQAYVQIFKDAFPDIRRLSTFYVEQGDTAIVELVLEGTHTGPLLSPEGTIPPTGKKVVWKAADFVRVTGGKIIAWHAYWDRVAFATQLGLAK
jgi:ketosteroid isomerase-like protein